MRLILAATALFCVHIHAREPEPPVVPPEFDKSEFLDRIKTVADEQAERARRSISCCKGNAKDCNFSRRTSKNYYRTKNVIKDGAGEVGAQGAAVKMGEFGDDLKDLGEDWKDACRQQANSCYEVGLTVVESLQAQCPECTKTDFDPIQQETRKCPLDGESRQVHITKRPIRKPYEPNPGAIPVPISPLDGRPSDGMPGPVVISHDNKEWRESMGHKRDSDKNGKEDGEGNDKLSTMSDSFSKIAGGRDRIADSPFQVAAAGASDFNAASTAMPADVQTAGSVGLFPSIGTVGLREPSSRSRSRNTNAIAGAQSAVANVWTNTNKAMQVQPRGNGGAQFTGASARNYASNPRPVGSGAQPVTLGQGTQRNQFNQPNISPQAMGSSGPSFKASGGSHSQSAGQNLAAYLPNGSLGPQARGIAGGSSGTSNPEILSQGKDVWQNMSTRMTYFCKMGRLYDCD